MTTNCVDVHPTDSIDTESESECPGTSSGHDADSISGNDHQKPRRPGASLLIDDRDSESVTSWLQQHHHTATQFNDVEAFIRHIEDGNVSWAVVSSAGIVMKHPKFDTLFRALIETDTDLYTAVDDCRLSSTLLLFGVRNRDFLDPYACEESEDTSLTSHAEALRRIEARIREMSITSSKSAAQAKRELLTPGQQELLDAADPLVPRRGEALAAKAGHQYDGHTKSLLSSLVKFNLLGKRRDGYVRIVQSHDEVRTDNAE